MDEKGEKGYANGGQRNTHLKTMVKITLVFMIMPQIEGEEEGEDIARIDSNDPG